MGGTRKGIRLPEARRSRLNEFARLSRKHPTRGEHALWNRLRNRRVDGVKFRRQAILGPFVADFYSAELQLVVEVDGPIHDELEVRERDAARQRWLEKFNLTFVRVSADDAERETDSCVRRIRDAIRRRRSELKLADEQQGYEPDCRIR